jgi:hypothetical protein
VLCFGAVPLGFATDAPYLDAASFTVGKNLQKSHTKNHAKQKNVSYQMDK